MKCTHSLFERMGTNGNSPPVGSSLSSTLPMDKHDRARSQPMPDLLYGGAHRLNSDLRASTSTNSYTGRDPNAHPQLSDYLGSEVVNQVSNLGNKDSVVSPFVGEQIGNKDNEVSPFTGEQIGKDPNSTDDASWKIASKTQSTMFPPNGFAKLPIKVPVPSFPSGHRIDGVPPSTLPGVYDYCQPASHRFRFSAGPNFTRAPFRPVQQPLMTTPSMIRGPNENFSRTRSEVFSSNPQTFGIAYLQTYVPVLIPISRISGIHEFGNMARAAASSSFGSQDVRGHVSGNPNLVGNTLIPLVPLNHSPSSTPRGSPDVLYKLDDFSIYSNVSPHVGIQSALPATAAVEPPIESGRRYYIRRTVSAPFVQILPTTARQTSRQRSFEHQSRAHGAARNVPDDHSGTSQVIKKHKPPSNHCHVCVRVAARFGFVTCGNNSNGSCRKVVCKFCFVLHGWDWNVAKTDASWVCPHCRGECGERASCVSYTKTNKKRILKRDSGAKKDKRSKLA